jgi:exodeoxyribonuclease-5
MLQSYIQSLLSDNLGHKPTSDQEVAINALSDYVVQNSNDSIFILKGYAGTGKTSLINALVRTLESAGISSVMMAPTGRAAKVLTSYSGKQAFTIHKKIYRQKGTGDALGSFALNFNRERETWFIVDEASMINNELTDNSPFGSGGLLDDLIEFVYSGSGCKLVLAGDTAQLPPVGSDRSPALDTAIVGLYGFNIVSVELKEVVRQSESSGILMNATSIRKRIEESDLAIPGFTTDGYPDIFHLRGDTLMEELEQAYSVAGTDGTIVIVNSNRMANRYNQGIRNRILYREEEISSGDMIMVVKNNYHWTAEIDGFEFIANGDIARIKRISSFGEMYGFRFADMILEFPDHNIDLEVKVNLDSLNSEKASLTSEQNRELFFKAEEDYMHIKTRKKRFDAIRNDPFFNALQIKFAYAVTCHKAQGGQWERVFIDQGMFNRAPVTIDYLRWLYTAVTRATDKLCLVNFDASFLK